MTVDDVRKELDRIRSMARDPEAAHGSEDNLHQEVLDAIAEGNCDDPAALAAAALQSTLISFPRWCA